MGRFLHTAFLIVAAGLLGWINSGRAEEKPVGGKPGEPSFATPQQAYEAFAKAHLDHDWVAAWRCFTPKLQDSVAFECVFQLGLQSAETRKSLGLDDPKNQEKYFRTESEVSPTPEPKTDEERRQAVAAAVRDKPGLYGLLQRVDSESESPTDWKTPLRQVAVKKERAQGVVTRYIFSIEGKPGEPAVKKLSPYDSPVYFQLTKTGWLIDLPTSEESQAYADSLRK
ncbi:hypothetical protein [Anatilimnocola floriformis]|uniref:hypothetical protein n=1 Tax=Anatilimnocola floriformis TaxID=2948575 RepID=UPI0020C33411|nr:hypothetical protein [Anatilimnocola floriformis]